MKRLVLLASILGACAAAAATTIGAAPSQPATTLDLTSTMTSFHLAVVAKPAGAKPGHPSAGDLGYVTGKLFKGGKPFGRYTGVCAQLTGGNQQCTFVLGLPDGQIVTTAGYGALRTRSSTRATASSVKTNVTVPVGSIFLRIALGSPLD